MKHHLRPKSEVCKILLSSPTRLQGNYSQGDLLLEPIHSIQNSLFDRLNTEILLGRYHYMLVCKVPSENKNNIIIPNYSYVGDYISTALSTLYGKRFDNHGIIESSGLFWMPNYEQLITFSPHYYYPCYSNFTRKDIGINLDLRECHSIVDFALYSKNEKLFRYFFNAAKFYLSSIKSIDSDLDKAYLDLITCGEILSNFYDDYQEEELYDSDLRQLMERLVDYHVPDKDLSLIKKRLYQVKRRFVLTLSKLINEPFFDRTESKREDAKFTKENFEKSIKAAYDLRSRYVHTGFQLKDWIEIYAESEYNLSEVKIPGLIPNVDDKDLKKIIIRVPTYVGLERVMRFALLRFLHTNGVYIHRDLD